LVQLFKIANDQRIALFWNIAW